MKLDTPFYRLPLRFDPARLAAEASQFAEAEWRAHPQGHAGNTAIPLVAVNGNPDDDAVRGPMRPTPFLDRCPYFRQVLASLGTVLGRSRLMRIAGRGEATPHVDTNYYWLHHLRVHVPALTFPEVRFVCEDKDVHMAAGECWIFDTWRLHNVLNPNDRPRIHLVADTVGTAPFWDLVEAAERPFAPEGRPSSLARLVPFDPAAAPELAFESVNFPVVMNPWEQECLLADILEPFARGAEADPDALDRLQRLLVRHNRAWRGLWAKWGDGPGGHAAFEAARKELDAGLRSFVGRLRLPNGVDAVEALMQAIVRPAVNADLANPGRAGGVRTGERQGGPLAPRAESEPLAERADHPRPDVLAPPAPRPASLTQPLIIIAAPRSGSSLLFETLARSPDFWTIGGESHEVIEGLPQLTPAARDFASNRLTAADADPQSVARIRAAFLAKLRDRNGQPPGPGATQLRLLEKTPKNALRIPFLRAVFPDAKFVYLYRNPRDNISSGIDAWKSGRFVTYPKLPGWDGPPWSLLLVPGWRELKGQPLETIAARQWQLTHEQIMADLAELPADSWTGVTYESFLADPRGTAERLAAFAGVRWDDPLAGDLPLARHTLTPPDPDKWKRNAAELDRVLPGVMDTAKRAEQMATGERPPHPNPPPPGGRGQERNGPPLPTSPPVGEVAAQPRVGGPSSPADEPLRSVHTAGLPQLLATNRISLLVSTYQAGKLIVVRADGSRVNTHFRTFPSPMGLAVSGNRLAVGTKTAVWDFRDHPDAARKLDPPGRHDALYLPRSCHYTGDIRVHEIGFAADDELWLVNTRFSCLCTLDAAHSFVPRWRPAFVSALAPEDRCHLNGMAIVDGQPKYVTCLGATDTAGGWRENKRNGGLLLDVPTGEVLARGLSMPHSPRVYRDRLWVLESGDGGIGHLDAKTGKLVTLARLPGFTRGIDFAGRLAFVGLSQVRETAVFSGLPLTDRLAPEDRTCGVWVVDLTDGKTVGFLRFDSGVQEIFAVQVLHGASYPELLNEGEEAIDNTFVLPDEALAEVAV